MTLTSHNRRRTGQEAWRPVLYGQSRRVSSPSCFHPAAMACTTSTSAIECRRASISSKAVVILAPGEPPDPANEKEIFTRDVNFWLDDGGLIFLAGDTAFRVYQDILKKKCLVFADMFASSSANATEMFEDRPAVRLSDHPEGLAHFLQYLMPCVDLRHVLDIFALSSLLMSSYHVRLRDGVPVSDFSELHTAVHLAHKYQCPDIETRALSTLKRFYTSHFTDYSPDYARFDTTNLESPIIHPPPKASIAAVNLARLTDTLSVLPFALYQVCTLRGRMTDGYKRRNGSIEYLAAADLQLCIDARAELARQVALFAGTVFTVRASDGYEGHGQCISALSDILEQVELSTLGACDIFNCYDSAIEEWAEAFGLCGVCKREMRKREVEERRRAWMLLPGIFGLSVKACGFTVDDGRSQP